MIFRVSLVLALIASSLCVFSQRKDTIVFKNITKGIDTFYMIRTFLDKNKTVQETYYGFSNNSGINISIDTFINTKDKIKKLYKGADLDFLSKDKFLKGESSKEFSSNGQDTSIYLLYQPIKIIHAIDKTFYLYSITYIKNGSTVEALGDDIRYSIYEFDEGEVYRFTYRIEKIRKGYESYMKYFVW